MLGMFKELWFSGLSYYVIVLWLDDRVSEEDVASVFWLEMRWVRCIQVIWGGTMKVGHSDP